MISIAGTEFIKRHEGTVLRAYRDPVGILTIGIGFTNLSPAVTRMLGTIHSGMVITHEQAERVLQEVIRDDFWPAVERHFGTGAQHEKDAACSVAFNCGPGALQWTWAKLWQAGNKTAAGKRLTVTAVTGKGNPNPLPGLVRRRREETALLLLANYGATDIEGHSGRVRIVPGITRKLTTAERDYMAEWSAKLVRLGIAKTAATTAAQFTADIRAFQKGHPHLTQDGICGPATEAAITRALDARAKATKAGAGSVAIGATAEGAAQVPMQADALLSPGAGLLIGGACLAVAGGLLAWQYRDEIRHWFNRIFRRGA
ncbi:MAG: lysozyme [Rhabdaerophilum sp.]